MKLYSVRNPITQIDYLWPLAKQRLQVSDVRRVSLQRVPGADGAFSQYGHNPFPRDATNVTITFRVTPHQHGTTYTNLRNALNTAVDHGLPQQLTFIDDNNNTWFATGWLTDKSTDANEDHEWFSDWTVKFVLEDPVAFGILAGVNAWGQAGLKWGATGLKWGASPHTVALNGASIPLTIPNPIATAETRDMIFTFTGQYGPTTPGLATGYIVVQNTSIIDINTGNYVYFYILDTVVTGHSLIVDIGAGGVTKTTLDGGGNIIGASAELGVLGKLDLQYGYMRFRPQGDNVLLFSIAGTALSPLTGNVLVSWRPKFSLS